MATRAEQALAKSAKQVGNSIQFAPVVRPADLPRGAWLGLAMAKDDAALVRAASLIGPLGDDSLDAWGRLRDALLDYFLISTHVTGCPPAPNVLDPLPVTSVEVGEGENASSLLAKELNALIAGGVIALNTIVPFSVRATAGTRSKVWSQAINELLNFRAIGTCAHCGKLFLSSSPAPATTCSNACRKGLHIARKAK